MDSHKKKESQEAARKRKYCGCAEYLFPEAAVTMCQRLASLHNRVYYLLVLEAGSLRARCQQGHAPSPGSS